MTSVQRIGALLLCMVFCSISGHLSAQDIGENLPFDNSHQAAVNGIDIHYRLWMPEDTEIQGKILLVHGFAGSTYSWRHNARVLQNEGYVVVAVDAPPFGFSEKIKNINYVDDELEKLFWTLLDKLDTDHHLEDWQWDLAGHSMGACLVMRMIDSKQENIRSAVIVDGLVSFRLSKLEEWVFELFPVQVLVELYAKNFLFRQNYIEKVLDVAYGEAPSPSDVHNYLKPLREKMFVPAVLSKLTHARSNRLLDISTMEIPVLVVWGEKDKWLPLALGEKIQEKLPHARLAIVKGAAHCPMESDPVAFNRELTEFLKDPKQNVSPFIVKE